MNSIKISRRQAEPVPATHHAAVRFAVLAFIIATTTTTVALLSGCTQPIEVSSGNSNSGSLRSGRAATGGTGESSSTAAAGATSDGTTTTATAGNPAAAAPALLPIPEELLKQEIRGLDDKPFRLADYAGKVLVLDLWATWCPPCREEVPHLVALRQKYAAQGVEVIGLDIDPENETPEEVRAFAQEFGINYKLAWGDMELATVLMRGQDTIPQTLVVTRDGRIFKHFVGFNSGRTPARLNDAVEQALKVGG